MKLISTVVYVADVPGAMRFYTEAFGFEVRHFDPDVKLPGRLEGKRYQFGELNVPGGQIHFGTPALGALLIPGFPPNDTSSAIELAFYADDVEARYKRGIAAGAVALRPPERMPWGQTISYLRSPDGTYIAICSPPTIEPMR